MTAAGDFRTAADRTAAEVTIAGVPWPRYKLVALAVGFTVLIIVAAATASAAPAVLAAAGTATVVWVALGPLHKSRR
jgi:hypothetical protein